MKRGDFLIKKEHIFLLLFGIFLVITPSSLILADTQTNLSVLNTPPILQVVIPDQYWPEDTNNLNAFDLDDHFIDPNGDNITYNYSSVSNIVVIIDPITNYVSFYPDAGFIGERTITFYAQDQTGNSSSNPVLLSVGLDNVSPNWSSPAKSKGDVYQNDFINFTMSWVDNIELSHFIFSINQGETGWINYSSVNFSGTSNISIFEVQISASAGKTIQWGFYAWDTSLNLNFTLNNSFAVQTAVGESAPPPDDEDESSGTGVAQTTKKTTDLGLTPKRKLRDFRLSVFDFKLSLKQGTSKTVVLKISNIGTEDLSLKVSDVGLLDFVLFSETEFDLLPGNSKEITIDFRVPRSAYPGQYYGFINVDSGEVNKTVPVVLDVKQIDLDYDVILNISEEYKTIRPGRNAWANLYIYNIKDLFQTNITLYYAIKDYNGTVYNFSEEKINFSTSFVINRSLQVPEGTSEGKYIFYARVSDEDNIAIDSDFFFVGHRFALSSFLRSNMLFLFIILLSIFLAVFMVKYQKDRRKERILHLYMMLTKLKNLIKQSKTKEALELFLRIRSQYKEPLSEDILQDREKLKKEMLKLYETINPEALKKIQEQEKQKAAVKKTPVNTMNQGKKIQQSPQIIKKTNLVPNKSVQTLQTSNKIPNKTPQQKILKKIIPSPKRAVVKKVVKKPANPVQVQKPAQIPTKKVVVKKVIKKPIQKTIKNNQKQSK